MDPDPRFRALLQTFWLRPETALWRAIDIRAMEGFRLEEPSLDLGCGDGLFSFLRAGGQLDPGRDAFESMGHMESYFKNVDAFDHLEAGFDLPVVREPAYRITCGMDHKLNLLKKTEPLKLYREWVEGDANQPLPFTDQRFQSVFCNILYWLDQPAAVLGEIHRILKWGGQACIFLPNPRFFEASFFLNHGGPGAAPEYGFLSLLDRGRMELIQQVHPTTRWEEFIQGAGFTIERRTDTLSLPVARIWDVGLRPLFPPLLRMSRAMDWASLAPIKAEWVAILMRFLEPMVRLDAVKCLEGQGTFHCFWLAKERCA